MEVAGARLRVVAAGSGDPLLLVHGTGGPGTWPSLMAALPGRCCLALDRPGWAESAPVDWRGRDYGAYVADLLAGVLDALGVERADVAGASIGDTWALRLAARHPERVGRVVLMGGGPLVPEITVPPFIRLLASPAGALVIRVPQRPASVRAQLRGAGHGADLEAGRIPDAFVEWRVALDRGTASMRHERDMVRAIVRGGAFVPGLVFSDAELAAIEQPVLHAVGTADPVGTVAVWRRMGEVLRRGELDVVDGAGHVPWLGDPEPVARRVDAFLA